MSNVRYQELMLQYAVKVLTTAVVVVAVSELAKRSSFWGVSGTPIIPTCGI